MFFTAAMVTDVTQLWKGVADRMFKNGMDMCVAGSTGNPTSVSAGGQKRAGDGMLAEGKGVNSTMKSVASGSNTMVGGAAGRTLGQWGSLAAALAVSMALL